LIELVENMFHVEYYLYIASLNI